MIFDPATLPPRLDFVGREFPFPLALTYTRVWQEIDADQPIPAVLQMKDAFEAYLKFCASVAVADALAAGPPPELAAKLVGTLFKPLANGDWFTVLDDALRPARTAPPARRAVSALADVFFKPNGDRTEVGLILIGTNTRVGFVKWRNSELAHGAFRRDRGFYADQIAKWLPQLNRCLEALRPALAGSELCGVTPEGARVDWTGDQALPRVEHHRHEAWGEPLPLSLELADGRSLPLGPLLSMQSCRHPSCRQPSAFFFEGNEYAKEKHKTYFLEYFVGQTQTAKDWPPVRDLAAHLPEKFAFERTSYDHRKLAEDVKVVFRDVDREYRRPDYLLDAFWGARDAHPTGYYLWEGEQGVGKSFAAHGLERDGDDRGVTVLRYHVLPGAAAAYQTFIGELGQRVRDKLQFATQEIQALVSRHSELPKQFAGFVAEVMRANNLSGLVVVIDGLDELRDPEKPSGAVLTDFLPPVAELPHGCVVALTARPAMCGRVRERLAAIGLGARPDATRCPIVPGGDPNREVVRRYLREQEVEVLRSAAAVERVLELSGGVFLYAVHFARALAAGAYAAVDDLPEAGRFYADYLGRLRERVGDSLYETVYEKALMLLVAARVPVTRAALHRWGVPADRLTFALRDVADFVRELRHRSWHEGIGDSDEPRYAIAHEAFVRYATTDEDMSEKLWAAHCRIAETALLHVDTRWEDLDPADDADLYDVRFVLHHADRAELPAAHTLRSDDVLALVSSRFAADAAEVARHELSVELYEQCESLYRELVRSHDRADLADQLADTISDRVNALIAAKRPVGALDARDEVVKLFRDLVENQNRLGLTSRLAKALTAKGFRYASGREDEENVISCHDEAIELHRRVVAWKQTPEAFQDLAAAVHAKGVVLNWMKRYADALACHTQSVSLYYGMVEDWGRHAAASGLALALRWKGKDLRELGRVPEAERCASGAVAVLRDAVDRRGLTALTDNLADALFEKGFDLPAGREEDADACYEEAVSLWRNLVDNERRLELIPDLAKALVAKGHLLSKRGHTPRAFQCYDGAASFYRTLVSSQGRYQFAENLVSVVQSKGESLLKSDRVQEWFPNLLTEVRLARDALSQQPPEKEIISSTAKLGDAIAGVSLALVEASQVPEAQQCYAEAVEVFRDLTGRRARPEFAGNLASVLKSKGEALFASGRVPGWFPDFVEEVRLAKELFARQPSNDSVAAASKLGDDLTSVGLAFAKGGRLPEALSCYDEAASLFRRLSDRTGRLEFTGKIVSVLKSRGEGLLASSGVAEWFPDFMCQARLARDAFTPHSTSEAVAAIAKLATDLVEVSLMLAKAVRVTEAQDCSTEAIALYRALSERTGSPQYTSQAVRALETQAGALRDKGQGEDALRCYVEAVAVFRGTLVDLPQTLTTTLLVNQLAELLVRLGKFLEDLGRPKDAIPYYDDAAATYRNLIENHGREERAVDCASVLRKQGQLLRELGRPANALPCFAEAVALYRDAVEVQKRDDYRQHLGCALVDAGDSLEAHRRLREATLHYAEAADIFRSYFDTPGYDLLYHLLVAYAGLWDVAVAEVNWPAAATVMLAGLDAFSGKQRIGQVKPTGNEGRDLLVARLRALSPEQREQLFAAAGDRAGAIRQVVDKP